MTSESDTDEFGLWDAQCIACDDFTRVDGEGLCEECAAKLERDMIRQREWAYSATAYGCPRERLEELRSHVIREYGEELELIAPPQTEKREHRRPRKRRSKRRRDRGR